jgi:ribosomal protein S21
MITVGQRSNESSTQLLFRFTRRVKRSGVLKEVGKRRYTKRPVTKRQRRIAALYRAGKAAEVAHAKKLGTTV